MQVAGYTLPGGMLYVGRGLRSPSGSVEPAQIDPGLKVASRGIDVSSAQMGYWPTYQEISAQARAGYLTWLAGGRQDPRADIGFVFLFLYGLERRALIDIAADKSLRVELPYLRAEVARLLGLYPNNGSFGGYATRFLDVLDLSISEDSQTTSTPPALSTEYRWEAPVGLRVQIGSFAADGVPVPAEWALAWAWYHPEVHLRTPATRCKTEFSSLFSSRYRAAHGDGLVVRPLKKMVRVDYYAASSGIGSVELSMNVPDVFEAAAPKKHLVELVESAMVDLDAYSRFLGRNPDGGSSLTAAALLPGDLAGPQPPEVTALLGWARGLADSGSVTTGADVLSLWPSKVPHKLAKPETVALARLLERHHLGLEPDVRLGGPAITTPTQVVVFHTGAQVQPASATPSYASATTLLHLATAVAAADGSVSAEEQEHLVSHLERALDLSAGERVRLEAHMRWLSATGVKLTGLTKRVEVLALPQRMSIADLLVAVAAADGVISPEEVTSLSKIFKLLGLDPADVHSRLHALLSGGRPAPANSPVTVREAGEPDPGFPVGYLTQPTTSTPEAGFSLDADVIAAKFAETAAAGALLADIFNEDDPAPGAAPDPTALGTSPEGDTGSTGGQAPVSVPGLDAAHSPFLRAVLEQSSWARSDLEALGEELNLLPDGALDTINEFALDATGEPLLEEDAPDLFTINDYAREDLPV